MKHSNTPLLFTLLFCALFLAGWPGAHTYAQDDADGDDSTTSETKKPADGAAEGGTEEEPECD